MLEAAPPVEFEEVILFCTLNTPLHNIISVQYNVHGQMIFGYETRW
jgi:hypothetical protein